MTPRATVRLQLHAGFDFDAAAATVDYHRALGISHFYLSPIFTARAGSTHGYDVVDPGQVNPELGGEAGLLRLSARLREAGMGLVIDIVPNHMGVATPANRYWQDVLTWGPHSPFAHWFDIDWQAPRADGKLLLPVLGAHYREMLSSGELTLVFDAVTGAIELAYHDARFPLSPATSAQLLRRHAVWADVAAALAEATPETLPDIREALTRQARGSAGRHAMAEALLPYQSGRAGAAAALDNLLRQQHYRLSWWRNAAEAMNWRRFFEVSDLAGVRVEAGDVFEATHALALRLYADGIVDGLRVDHVDGLADPAGYCRKLRERLTALQPGRPKPLDRAPAWLVLEKILVPGESLPADWPVDGTTGYDFMDQAGAVLHDGNGETALRALWADLAEDPLGFEQHVQQAREQLLDENFGGEFGALARALRHHGHTAAAPMLGDTPLVAIRRVLRALLAAFRRYRTYHPYAAGVPTSDADTLALQQAYDGARQHLRLPDHALLLRIAHWLGLPDGISTSLQPPAAEALRRFQQLTPPLAAKSVEDTAFYRHAPLLSRNDVGSYPADVSAGVLAFHAANLRRQAESPRALLATATHDHKRGEDSRARLAVLSELPQEWRGAVEGWREAHTALRAMVPQPGGGLRPAPSPADELMLYQALLGAWPPGLQADDADGVADFTSRMAAWQEKALREAKNQSSWLLPDEVYEAACQAFLVALLQGEAAAAFVPALAGWVRRLTPAAVANALAQTLLRLTSPGVPDLYQGTEFADYSLVDPDNRRPVDFDARRAALDTPAPPWPQDGQLHGKQQLIGRVLALRRDQPDLFGSGDYLPLTVHGPQRDHVIAFARHVRGEAMSGSGGEVAALAWAITVTLRLPAGLLGPDAALAWQDTAIELPEGAPACWTDVLAGAGVAAGATGAADTASIEATAGRLPLAGVLAQAPVALLLPAAER